MRTIGPALMRHFPGLNHENLATLYLSEAKALADYVAAETRETAH